MSMKILITGATGFVGKTLVPYIYSQGVTNIALLVRDADKVKRIFPNLDLIVINTQDKQEWREVVIEYNADVVLHMAGLVTTRSDALTAHKSIEANVLFTTLLLEAISNTNCSYFINIGTFAEFLLGDGKYLPNTIYAASKIAVRPIIQFYQTQSSFKWINVILYTAYGRFNEQKKVLDYMIDAMDSSSPIDFTKGEQILDFIHVDDMADFFTVLLQRLPELQDSYVEFHLGTGRGYSIREVATIMEQVWGKKINANWGGIPYRKFDNMHAVAPISKNIELLGWRSKMSLDEGIRILKDDICQSIR